MLGDRRGPVRSDDVDGGGTFSTVLICRKSFLMMTLLEPFSYQAWAKTFTMEMIRTLKGSIVNGGGDDDEEVDNAGALVGGYVGSGSGNRCLVLEEVGRRREVPHSEPHFKHSLLLARLGRGSPMQEGPPRQGSGISASR